MQVKRPRCAPAIRLIGRVSQEAMIAVLRYLDLLGAGVWHIGRVNVKAGYFIVRYYPTNRRGRWEAVFTFDGTCVAD